MPALDLTPPIAIHSEPFHHEQNVAFDKNIVVGFNEEIKPGAGYILLSNGQDDTRRIAIHDSSQVEFLTNSGKYSTSVTSTLVINPSENLLSNSNYFVQVETGVIKDIAGNPLAGVTDTSSYQFKTSTDTTAPIALSSVPSNHSDNVSVMVGINARFNEPVRWTSKEMLITDRQGDTRYMSVDSSSGDAIRFITRLPLLPNTRYFLEVPPDMITDVAGNGFAGVQGSKFSIKTGNDDITAPEIFLNHISEPASVATNIRLQANELIKAGTGSITLSNGLGDIRKISVNDQGQVTFESPEYPSNIYGTALTINPSENLLPNSQYTVNIDASAITDLAGNPFVLAYGQRFPPFSTNSETSDTTPPIPLTASVDYGDKRQHISIATSIITDFNEPIQIGEGNIVISNSLDDTRIIAIGDRSQVNRQNAFFGVRITPNTKLLPGNRYHVLVDNGAIMDLAGNAYTGVQDPNVFTFETESLWTATSNPVMETNRGKSTGVYENKDVLTFYFNAPVTDYKSFKLSKHNFGGNDVVLSADGLSASVELTSESTVVKGDVLTLQGAVGKPGADGIIPTADIEFTL